MTTAICPFSRSPSTKRRGETLSRATRTTSGRGMIHVEWFPGGADGILEVNLYPQGSGVTSSRGTVIIGSNKGRAGIASQILRGITPKDMQRHGGSLEFNRNGKLYLQGNTGISAGVQKELSTIRGEPRVLPIFRAVSELDGDATYTIVKFVGVRIMDVNLTGGTKTKRVIVQPAALATRGAIPTTEAGMSELLFTRTRLVP